jgi:penicillin-binding protein 1A
VKLARRALAALVLLAAAGALGLAAWITWDLPSLAPLVDYRPALPSVVVDRAGRPVAEFYAERRRMTPLGEIPPHVIEAFLASEDASFFDHRGVDLAALVRATLANLRAGGAVRQGGSTITQQLAKNLLLTPERTVVRKLRDIALAVRIERALPKERILEIYLNDVYLGRGAYGVAQAAQAYFGKEPADVTDSEAALLAGLVAAPTRYSPTRNPDAAEARRRWVLERMAALGRLSPAERDAAIADRPSVIAQIPPAVDPVAVAFVEEVRLELFGRLGEDTVRRGGLRIETTLDLDLQRRAVHALRSGLEGVDRRQRGWQGPREHVSAEELAITADALRRANGLVAEQRGPVPLPQARTLRGVVLAVEGEGARARVALAPGVEAELRWDDAAWAAREGKWREARSLETLLAPGDVAFFESVAGEPGAPPRVRLVQPPAVQGALVSVEVETGAVLALVGGYDFRPGQFNRATQARRQPGSAFKPFVYGAALEAGFPTSAVVYDYQVETYSRKLGRWWRPKNAGGVLRGPVPIFEAFARSLNNATIRLLDDLGTARVASFARRAGIVSPLAEDRSLALGTSEVTPLELTAAYATFARGGERRTPHLVRRVLDRDGRVVANALPVSPAEPPSSPQGPADDAPADALATKAPARSAAKPVPTPDASGISPVDAYLLTHLMRGTIRRGYGTAHAAAKLDAPLAGKTGSTNQNRDAWFVGYSPRVATGVWVGHDVPTRELGRSETGGRAALPIWIEFMEPTLAAFPDEDGYDVPHGVHFAWTDPESRTAQRSDRYVAWAEPFATGRKPRRSTYVPPPVVPEPEPEFTPGAGPPPTLSSFQQIGAPTPAQPLVE